MTSQLTVKKYFDQPLSGKKANKIRGQYVLAARSAPSLSSSFENKPEQHVIIFLKINDFSAFINFKKM